MNAYLPKIVVAIQLTAAAASASAVTLNPKGLGQVLIYPYYTVNKNQDTLLSLANAADVGKAVKVRVHEGYNGRDVLSFNVFIAPHDVWVAGVSAIGGTTTGARLSSSDFSCTDGLASPQPLSSRRYDGADATAGADGGPTDIARTREGWIEVLVMGDIAAGSALDVAVSHPQPGSPDAGVPGCGAPIGDDAATARDLVPPTSGLFGAADIVDVSQGLFYAYDASALSGFFDLTTSTLYTAPGAPTPSLQSAASVASLAGGALATILTDSGAPLTLDYARGIDAVTAVLQADTLYNEYLVAASLGASSDWVVTFPTKHFYVDQQLYPSDQIAPFETAFAGGRSDVTVKYDVYDREQGTTPIPDCPGGDPQCPPSPIVLGYETNVINLQPASESALGSTLTTSVAPFAGSGWIRLDLGGKPDEFLGFYRHYMINGSGPDGSYYLNGLPALGFMVYNIVNTQAQPGRLANYSGLFPHRASVSCGGAPVPSVSICP